MQRLTRLSLAHPGSTLALLAVATLGLGAGALRLETDVGYRSLLGGDHPSVVRFDGFLARFGGGFPLAAVWRCDRTPNCASALDASALEMADDVTRALSAEPSIRAVESPANSPVLVPGDGDPVLRRLVEDGVVATDRAWLAERVLNDSLWPRQLVSVDGRTGAIVLEVASSESRDNVAAYRALDAALAPHEAAGWEFDRVGGPVEFVVAGGELQADIARLVPVMVALVGVVLFALFRSPALAIAALVSVGVSVLWAFGLMGWLGWPQNTVTQALPPLLLVVGVCDAIHLLARYASEAGEHPEQGRHALLERVAGDIGTPCVATSLTTAAGFASFATSGLASFSRFGLIAAFGAVAALILTFTLLPILAVRIRPDASRALRASARWDAGLRRVVALSQRHAGPVLALTGILGAVFGVGFAALRVDASFEDLYGADSQVVRWARSVGDHLRKPDTLEIELRAPAAARIDDPDTLGVITAVASALAEVDGLGPSRSLADPISLVHQLANDDDPFWYRVPGRAEDVREILDALEEKDPRTLARWRGVDARYYRVSVESEKPPQDEMRRIFSEVGQRLDAILPTGWSATSTGPLAIVNDMIAEIQRTQLVSFATATAIVIALVALFLRSLLFAALAIVPTVLPVVATLGAMGLAGVPLDVGSAMVAAIVIGIAVDDAVHLLTQYRRHLVLGEAPAAAMAAAVMHAGRAIATTSVALTLGFFALTISSWGTVASFGALAGTAIFGALFADLLVLPALVRVTSRGR